MARETAMHLLNRHAKAIVNVSLLVRGTGIVGGCVGQGDVKSGVRCKGRGQFIDKRGKVRRRVDRLGVVYELVSQFADFFRAGGLNLLSARTILVIYAFTNGERRKPLGLSVGVV
jgi:hypothetical protein